ncbi:MAG: DUF3307 domain-containing protein [Pseudohongiellaceae bacterium]|nr:DUF3307 domain-containing protein [Pseudohongiellaceae bacterium]
MPMLELFFKLIVVHALADFVLQSEAMVKGKNPHHEIHKPKNPNFPSWHYWLGSHALIHGGLVYLVTNSVILGVVETISHFCIDLSKCNGKIGFHQDQGLHIAFKIGYLFFV